MLLRLASLLQSAHPNLNDVLQQAGTFMRHFSFSGMGGLAPKLQATTRSGGLFRTELPPLVPDPEFRCKAGMGKQITDSLLPAKQYGRTPCSVVWQLDYSGLSARTITLMTSPTRNSDAPTKDNILRIVAALAIRIHPGCKPASPSSV